MFHGSSLSRFGASGKPGAVQSVKSADLRIRFGSKEGSPSWVLDELAASDVNASAKLSSPPGGRLGGDGRFDSPRGLRVGWAGHGKTTILASGGSRGGTRRFPGNAGMQWRLKLTTHSGGHQTWSGPSASAR